MTADHLLDPKYNPLFILLQTKQWKAALQQLYENPSLAEGAIKLSGFHSAGGGERECNKVKTTVNALHIACKHNAPLDVIESIIKANNSAASQKESSYQRLPLHVAIMNQCNNYKVIGALIESCPKAVSSQDIHGRLPIHYACRDSVHGERYLRYLLKAYPESVHVADDKGFLPIHVACRSGMPLLIVNMLLRVGPETILSKTNNGATPVHCAKSAKKNLLLDSSSSTTTTTTKKKKKKQQQQGKNAADDEEKQKKQEEIQEQIIELLTSVARETKKMVTEEMKSLSSSPPPSISSSTIDESYRSWTSSYSGAGAGAGARTLCTKFTNCSTTSSSSLRSNYGLLRSIRSNITSSSYPLPNGISSSSSSSMRSNNNKKNDTIPIGICIVDRAISLSESSSSATEDESCISIEEH